MYHFNFIEETSIETEAKHSETQEKEPMITSENETRSLSFLNRTATFLHKYIDQPNCVRIYISKN